MLLSLARKPLSHEVMLSLAWVALSGCSLDLAAWKCRAVCQADAQYVEQLCSAELERCIASCAVATRAAPTACGQCVVDHSGVAVTCGVVPGCVCIAFTGSAAGDCAAPCSADAGVALNLASGPGASANACAAACARPACGVDALNQCTDTCQALTAGLSPECAACVVRGISVTPMSTGTAMLCPFTVPRPSVDCAGVCFPG